MQLANLLNKSGTKLEFFSPNEIRQLTTGRHSDPSLADLDMPSEFDGLLEALGLPAPGPTTLRLQFSRQGTPPKSTQRGTYGAISSLYEFNPTTRAHTLVDNIQWGKAIIRLGYTEHRWNYQTSAQEAHGCTLTEYRSHDTKLPKKPNLNGITVKDVEMIVWPSERHYNHTLQGWDNCNAVGIQVEWKGETFWIHTTMRIAEPVFGIYIDRQGKLADANGKTYGTFPPLSTYLNRNSYSNKATGEFDFTLEDYSDLSGLFVGEQSMNNLLHAKAQEGNYLSTDSMKKPGLTKFYKADNMAALGQELFDNGEYMAWMAFRSLLKNGGKSIRKVKVSTVVNEEFMGITTVKELKAKLDVFQEKSWDDAIESFPYFAQKRKETVRKDTDRAIRKRVQDLDEIELDQNKYPLTYAALTEGEIPLPAIFPGQETYFLTNDNWDLWEEMLQKFPEETLKCAKEAAARKNYERDLMSYFYFVLYQLPEYLEKQTGYAWTCSPRLVESQYELEPQAVEEDRGVIKQRSALTPVADNKKHHVVVPYCSMAVHGRMTTYCYAHTYNVLSRGMMFDGNVVTKDVEEKLNGKDDYGLMFYTLTGSHTNRGYPTFLIIFERLKSKGKTRVHFHRVHPMRSKDGDRNPINNWMKVAYNWMIGNVSTADIAFQQGDLAFIRVPAAKAAKIDFTGAGTVTDCDSHCFAKAVPYLPYDGKKKHVLGHIQIEGQNMLNHPEHDNVPIRVEGIFEVRQCRSWEANPKGVWTLNFD